MTTNVYKICNLPFKMSMVVDFLIEGCAAPIRRKNADFPDGIACCFLFFVGEKSLFPRGF